MSTTPEVELVIMNRDDDEDKPVSPDVEALDKPVLRLWWPDHRR